MKTSNNELDQQLEIKQLQHELEALQISIIRKENRLKQLQKQLKKEESEDSPPLDKYGTPIKLQSYVKLLTTSKSGPFKGQTHATVSGYTDKGRIVVQHLELDKETTEQKKENVQVIH